MQLVPRLLFDYRSDDEGMMKELNSGKYIVNQLRGVNAIFESHRALDMAQLRGIMRVGFYTAIEREYDYWIDRSIKSRRFTDLEQQLGAMKYRPNSKAAVEIVVKLMAAHGRVREAVALMERNEIVPDDTTLREMQKLLSHHERRGMNTGQQANIVLNSAFEFWDLGTEFHGIQPYQYIANEWLMPSSKARETIVVSQQRDNALFGLTHARLGTYLRVQSFGPDPEGYLFLTQRNTDLGRVLENGVDVSLLARSSVAGSLTAFMRVTYEHQTDRFQDIWPESQGWVTDQWQRIQLRFDLTEFRLEHTGPSSLVSLFIRVPTETALTLDLADVSMIPQGEGTSLAPYIRENERQRATERSFPCGRDARVEPVGGRHMRLLLPPAEQARIRPDSRFYIRSEFVLVLANGDFVEVQCETAHWDSGEMSPEGKPFVKIRLDRDIEHPGSVLDHFLLVTNYLEG